MRWWHRKGRTSRHPFILCIVPEPFDYVSRRQKEAIEIYSKVEVSIPTLVRLRRPFLHAIRVDTAHEKLQHCMLRYNQQKILDYRYMARKIVTQYTASFLRPFSWFHNAVLFAGVKRCYLATEAFDNHRSSPCQ